MKCNLFFILSPLLFLAFSPAGAEPETRFTNYTKEVYFAAGRISMVDVIFMLLKARDNPSDPELDRNGDGSYSINDAVALVLEIMRGNCPDAEAALASAEGMQSVTGIEGLTPGDIEYIEGRLALMNLSREQRAALSQALYGAAEAPGLPRAFSLAQNMPNPFNPSTTITFTVPVGTSERVFLEVFDLRGKLVRTLVERAMGSGLHSVFWHGDDNSGRRVGSGIYFYRLRAGKFSRTRKMVLLK